MTAEGTGRRKFTQLMTNHVLSNVNRYELISVVYSNSMTYKVRRDN